MRLCAGCDHQAFENGHARAQQVLGFKVLASHLQQQGWFIMFEGTFGQPGEQLILLFRLHAAKAQLIQHRLEVRTLGHAACSITLEHGRVDVELLWQIRDGTKWSRMQMCRTETEIPYGAKLERHAQAMCVVPVRLNEDMILLGEGEGGDQVPVRNVVRETREPFPLLWGQKGPGHRVASSVIKKGGSQRAIETLEIKVFFQV